MNKLVYSTSLLLLGIVPMGSMATAAEISFADRFKKAEQQAVVTIQAGPEDVLVIESGTYTLSGRRFIVAAQKARISGDVVIQSYDPAATPSVKVGLGTTGDPGRKGDDYNCGRSGCPGSPGGKGKTGVLGDPGAASGDIAFDILDLDGEGTISIIPKGQTGGQGQQGGKGGTGGQGGRGAQRSCGGMLGLDTKAGPGDAGPAGIGGPGGTGGQGGPGGASTNVYLHDQLFDLVALKRIVIDTTGGLGGKGGEAGPAGDGGQGNSGGAGNSCGGGGRGSGPGGSGSLGEIGVAGVAGTQGKVLYTTFTGGQPSELPASSERTLQDVSVEAISGEADACFRGQRLTREVCISPDRRVVGHTLTTQMTSGMTEAKLNLVPVSGRINCLSVEGEVKRSTYPTLQIRGHAPSVIMRCPELQAVFKIDIISLPNPNP